MKRLRLAAPAAVLLASVAGTSVSGGASSERVQPDEVEVALGLREAAEMSLLGADRTGPEIAGWKVKEERGRLWPSVFLQGRYSNESLSTASTTDQSQLGVTGTLQRYGGDVVTSVNLFQFLESRPRIQAAQADERAARMRLLQEQGDRVLRTAAAYLALLAEREGLTGLEALKGQHLAFLRGQEQRFEKDEIPRIGIVRARGDVLAVDREQLAARGRAVSAELELRKLTGLKPDRRIALAFGPEQIDLAFIDGQGLSGLLALAKEANPRFLAANAAVDKAQRELEATRSLRYPSLLFSGSYGYGHEDVADRNLPSNDQRRHSLFLTLAIPIFDGGVGTARIAQSELQARSRLIEAQRTGAEIKGQIEEEYWAYTERQRTVELLDRQVRLAEEELRQADARSRGGLVPPSERLGALSKLARLKGDLTRAKSDVWVKGIALTLAVGRNPLLPTSASVPRRDARRPSGGPALEPGRLPDPPPVSRPDPPGIMLASAVAIGEPSPPGPLGAIKTVSANAPPALARPPQKSVAPAAPLAPAVAAKTPSEVQPTPRTSIVAVASPPRPQPARRLARIEVARADSTAKVSLVADGPIVRYSAFGLQEPPRFVVDLEDLEVSDTEVQRALEVAAGDLKRVRVGRYRGTVRIVLDLARETLRLPRIIERDTGLEIAVADDP